MNDLEQGAGASLVVTWRADQKTSPCWWVVSDGYGAERDIVVYSPALFIVVYLCAPFLSSLSEKITQCFNAVHPSKELG